MPRISRWIGTVIVLALLIAAGTLLFRELHHFHWRDFERSLREIPAWRIAAAAALTVLSYNVLVGYDYLALRFTGRWLSWRQTALISFLGFTSSYNFGALLGGTSIRFRLYSSVGLTAVDILKIGVALFVTFWLGAGVVGGVLFVFDPLPIPQASHLPLDSSRPIGVVLLLSVAAFFAVTVVRQKPLTFRGWSVQLPSWRLALLQMLVASADLVVAAAVAYVLLAPALDVGFVKFVGAWLLAIWVALLSHVPGGVGILELTLLWVLKPHDPDQVLAGLLVFRATYYLIPLLIAGCLMLGREYAENRAALTRALAAAGSLSAVVPAVVSLLTFAAGLTLLFSAAAPDLFGRMHWLRIPIPLPLLELSHFAGSLIGATLLILAWGLRRRIDSAYWLALGMISLGIVTSLLRGLNFEEAGVLAMVEIVLILARRQFYRHGSLVNQPLTPAWLGSIAAALIAAAWLALFAHRHVEYRSDLWWSFSLHADAPRALRAIVGASGLVLLFVVAAMVRAARPSTGLQREEELPVVEQIVAAAPVHYANFAYLRDKHFLINEVENAFVMFGIQGRSWIALGDPIGPVDQWSELAWRFREQCDRHDVNSVFYQVAPEHLAMYVDLGLSLFKLGEEGRVPLADFSLEGPQRRNLRQTLNRVTRAGIVFDLVPRERVPAILPELRKISDAWLQQKNVREKGFSLGRFDEHYLDHFPIATMLHEDRIVAFANVLPTGPKHEFSVDLIRYLPDQEPSIMEALLIEVMRWGSANGYEWFSLGMAPMSGLERHPLAPLWNKLGNLLFQHGEHFYNFQGLRQYKEKFHPVWQPRYLAARGGLALPRILSDVAALISGGMVGLLKR